MKGNERRGAEEVAEWISDQILTGSQLNGHVIYCSVSEWTWSIGFVVDNIIICGAPAIHSNIIAACHKSIVPVINPLWSRPAGSEWLTSMKRRVIWASLYLKWTMSVTRKLWRQILLYVSALWDTKPVVLKRFDIFDILCMSGMEQRNIHDITAYALTVMSRFVARFWWTRISSESS
jgi:hypothetical protein